MSRASKCDAVAILNRTTKLFVESVHHVSDIHANTSQFTPKKSRRRRKEGGKRKRRKGKTRILGENKIYLYVRYNMS